MRGSVAAMLESINQESQYTLDENGKRVKDGRGTPTKRTEAFRALKEQYAKIVAEGGDMIPCTWPPDTPGMWQWEEVQA